MKPGQIHWLESEASHDCSGRPQPYFETNPERLRHNGLPWLVGFDRNRRRRILAGVSHLARAAGMGVAPSRLNVAGRFILAGEVVASVLFAMKHPAPQWVTSQ
jgi:hypothetical protein